MNDFAVRLTILVEGQECVISPDIAISAPGSAMPWHYHSFYESTAHFLAEANKAANILRALQAPARWARREPKPLKAEYDQCAWVVSVDERKP